ncbi:MAG TPA: hypothetical protein ENJ10_10950 [Caldithrix abyssi]|uniref:PorV/PorQ family protein n=1 Tax=Caldithrix abyssi TaxID=187145 RepID=A0A7V1LNG6_CALAY|nr:hypothetical protein [Caldithrix abyssi]
MINLLQKQKSSLLASAMLLVLLAVMTLPAQINHHGGRAGAFLRIGLGGRSMAMGNTGAAMPGGAYAFFSNPALTGLEGKKVAALSGNFMSLDRYAYFAGYTAPVPPKAAVALGWLTSGTGNLRSYNSIGQDVGGINHAMHAIYGTFMRTFGPDLRVGANLKMVIENINDGTAEFDYSALGVGGDVGLYYRWSDNLGLALVVENMGVDLKANTEKIFSRGGNTSFSLPVIYKAGMFYNTPLSWLNVAYDFVTSDQSEFEHRLGVEALYSENIALRMGFNGTRFTYGAGMDFKFMGKVSYLDYVFASSVVDEGASHLFSWQFFF